MAFLHRRFPLSERSKRVIGLSTGLNPLYTGLVFGYSIYPATNVSIFGTLWHALVLSSIMAFGTGGIPVLLWLRYEIRSPGVLLACLLVFWHVLVEFPSIGSGQGDSPRVSLRVHRSAVLSHGVRIFRRWGSLAPGL